VQRKDLRQEALKSAGVSPVVDAAMITRFRGVGADFRDAGFWDAAGALQLIGRLGHTKWGSSEYGCKPGVPFAAQDQFCGPKPL
jgi:hypothetical protein